jgi:hypothetical protein
LQSQHEYKLQQQRDNIGKKIYKKKRKNYQLRLLAFKQELQKISARLQTELAAETHLAEGQWLEDQVNMLKLRMFQAGTRIPMVSRTEGQHLAPLKTFIKNKGSK